MTDNTTAAVTAARRRGWLRRGLRQLVRVALWAGAASGLLLLLLLAWSTGNASRLAEQYGVLLVLNGVFALALFVWMVALIVRLLRQWRNRQFGVRLTTRLALAFALIGVAPGLLIYLISVQFMSRSIESWFNVRVDSALEAGLNLGRAALDARLADLQTQARRWAAELARTPESQLAATLTQLRQRASVREALVFTGAGRTLVFSSNTLGVLPEPPASTILNALRVSRLYAAAEVDTPTENTLDTTPDSAATPAAVGATAAAVTTAADDAQPLRLRVVVPLIDAQPQGLPVTALGAATLASDARWLQLVQPVAAQVSDNTARVQAGFRDYQELALSRLGLRKLYGITLTMALLFAVFGSVAVALALARRLVRPLLALAAGTRAVSAGDFRPLPEGAGRHHGDDEIGELTRAFNAMTRQLGEAQRLVENHRQQLQRANLYLESVLANLSSGVLAFDEGFRVTLVNRGAQTILHADLRTVVGAPLETVAALLPLAERIRRAFAEHAAVGSERSHWQEQFELPVAGATLTLLARGTHLLESQPHPQPASHEAVSPRPLAGEGAPGLAKPGAGEGRPAAAPPPRQSERSAGRGFLVVFDDISEVISANRTVAWGEVARRLAHEIKNPLTPIQLSAERLAAKLADQLSAEHAAMLARSTATIVNQVAALKNMVDGFREYARTPPAVMARVDFNALVAEVLTLYGWEGTTPSSPTPLPPRGRGESFLGAACSPLPPGGRGAGGEGAHSFPPRGGRGAAPHSPRFDVTLAPDAPAVIGDATQLRQVVHNLLANARDAVAAQGADGVIRVTTQLIVAAHSPTMLRLTVADSGSGFAPPVLARATEPYVTTKAHGSGLGLAIVDKIVTAHGGRLDIGNRHGGGARVSVLLTVAPATDDNAVL